MRTIVHVLLTSLLLPVSNLALSQQYLPLEVGNRWDYIGSYYDRDTHKGYRDTLMLRVAGYGIQANGREYYELEESRPGRHSWPLCETRFIRVDSNRMYAYYEEDSTEEMYLRFDAVQSESWTLMHGVFMEIQLEKVDSTDVFQLPTHTLTFHRDGLVSDWITLSERFGPISSHFEGEPPGTREDDITLAGCVLSGITYGELVVDVERLQHAPEVDFLQPAYPNPFRVATTTLFTLKKPGTAVITIVNTFGTVVARHTLDARAGWNQFQWKPEGLPPGVYMLALNSGEAVRTAKLVIAK
jgi:hypothetical protein